MFFAGRKTHHVSGLLRNAGIAAAAACLTFSTASAAVNIREVPTAILSQPDGGIKVIAHRELVDGPSFSIEDCYRTDKGWDLGRLRRVQEEYYKAAKIYHPANSTNGIPNQILDLLPTITQAAKNYGLDPDLIVSIIKAESFGYLHAVGPKGELGLMQININDPSIRLSKWQYENIFDPETNIDIGASILKRFIREFNGNVLKAIEAYNSGSRCVMSGKIPRSTKTYYVTAVTECMREMRELSNPGVE